MKKGDEALIKVEFQGHVQGKVYCVDPINRANYVYADPEQVTTLAEIERDLLSKIEVKLNYELYCAFKDRCQEDELQELASQVIVDIKKELQDEQTRMDTFSLQVETVIRRDQDPSRHV